MDPPMDPPMDPYPELAVLVCRTVVLLGLGLGDLLTAEEVENCRRVTTGENNFRSEDFRSTLPGTSSCRRDDWGVVGQEWACSDSNCFRMGVPARCGGVGLRVGRRSRRGLGERERESRGRTTRSRPSDLGVREGDLEVERTLI